MGNFYVNFTVKTGDSAGVVNTLKASGRAAAVLAVPGADVLVLDKWSDKQDSTVIVSLAESLSREHQCPVLAVLNHDDDILCYWLFDKGSRLDAYNSCPDYFGDTSETDRGGDPEILCRVLGVPSAVETVRRILDGDDFVFAFERHSGLVKALGLPEWAVGLGFTYLGEGELPDGVEANQIIRVP